MDQNNLYVSCIKIQGVPILPPLINSDKRQELQEYKRQALLLEQFYSSRKSNKKQIEDERIVVHSKSTESEENASMFSNDQSYKINQILNEIGNPLKYVPYKNENAKTLNLSSSLIDVSEYSSDTKESFENKRINEPKLRSTGVLDLAPPIFCENYNTNSVNIFSGRTEVVLEGNSIDIGDEKEVCDRPRLIRSNSYTLDNPSPLLLAHLKRQSSVSLSSDQGLTESYTHENESVRVNLYKSTNEEEINFKNNILENSVDKKYSNVTEVNEISNAAKENQENRNNSINQQPTVEVITTDIMVQEINITTPINDSSISKKNLIGLLNGNAETNTDEKARIRSVEEEVRTPNTETELKLLLNQIPEIYSSKILELIEKQKKEHQKNLENYEISTKDLLDRRNIQINNYMSDQHDKEIKNWEEFSINSTQNVCPKKKSENIEIVRRARSISDCTTLNLSDSSKQGRSSLAESQSLYFDMSTSGSELLEDLSSRTVKILDQDGEYCLDNWDIHDKTYLDTLSESKAKQNSIDNIAAVTDEKIMLKERENKAASVIGAYVKGYLVRRLMKTARVQTLIQTIQDALLCALELQGLDTIEEADVELHRRLIHQVSAACYEFHDVFFALTVPEQMDVIAIDREKKRKNLSVRTSRSSIDFHPKSRSSSNARLTKSLTKV